jgi:hypothetical protein
MWANSVWGLFGLSASCIMTMLGLSPDSPWQSSLLLGAVLFFVGSVGVLCWPLHQSVNRAKVASLVVHPTRAIRLIEPPHIIILGLLIAISGVVWLFSSESRSSKTATDRAAVLIAPFQAQIDSLNRQIASLKSSAHPTNPVLVTPAKISRVYSPADVRNLLDALTDAQKIVDEVISPPYFRVENLMINHQLLNGTQQFAGILTELRDQIKNEVWPEVDDFVYKKNAAYKEEMEFAFALEKEATKGAMLRKLDIAIDAIKKLPPNPGPDLAQLVKPQMKAVADEIQPKVYDWIGSSRTRIASMTASLEKDGTIIGLPTSASNGSPSGGGIYGNTFKGNTIENSVGGIRIRGGNIRDNAFEENKMKNSPNGILLEETDKGSKK